MKNIQMVDLKSQYQKIKNEVNTGIQEVIDSATFIKGGKVTDFQHQLETYLNVRHVIPVGNGTDALQIALMSLGLVSGDEVIIPTFTFISTAEVVALLGLTPVLVDVEFGSFNISIESIKKAITPKTKAIVPVHLFGQNACMESIIALAKEHHLFVIEDACQSIGSTYTFSDGRKVQSGCMGDIGCTSFFPSKNLGCYGDGGAIFTNNEKLADKMRAISNHGMVTRYHHELIGVNSRLDSIQAAILEVKLKQLDQYSICRQKAAAFYDAAFANNDKIIIPERSDQSSHVFHQYTLKLNGVDRTGLQKYLTEKGIPAMIYYPVPIHLQKAYQDIRYKAGDFPVAEKLCKCVLSLPMHTELSEEQLKYITGNVLEFVEL
jgi:UDP-2-acetamido-2-deoxy-ribo-hexuluronate aminotransferase